MTSTQKHLIFATAWLFGWPVLLLALYSFDAFHTGQLQTKLLSVAWGLGLVATFGSWSFHDASARGKSVLLAAVFTAAWFILFFFAAVPYFFATRGAKHGFVASLRYLAFYAACLGGWLLVILILRVFT